MKRYRLMRWDLVFGGLIVLLLLNGMVNYQYSSNAQHQLATALSGRVVDLEATLLAGQLNRLKTELTPPIDPIALEHTSSQLAAGAAMLRQANGSAAAIQLATELEHLSDHVAAISSDSSELPPTVDNITAAEAALASYRINEARSFAALQGLQRDSETNRLLSISASLLALAVLIAGWYLLLQRMRTPLQSLAEGLEAVRSGDFSRRLDHSLPREFAAVTDSYRGMVEALGERQQSLDTQLRRTALLTRLALELRETLEPQQVIERVLQVVGANLVLDSATILINTNSNNAEGYRWQDGEIQPLPAERATRLAQYGIESAALHNGNSTLISDVAASERWQTTSLAPEHSGSAMILPLQQNRISIGSLTIFSRRPKTFSHVDLLLLESVAAQAGIAIGAARRYQDERQRREQAVALLSLSQFLTGERSTIDLAQLIDRQSRAIFRAEHGLLYLRPTGFNIRPLPVGSAPTDMDARVLQQASEAAAQACSSGQIITSGMPSADTCVALPLIHAGNTIGACVLVRTAHDISFPAALWSLLTVFVNAVASACANTQLIEQLRVYTERLEGLVQQRTVELSRSRDLLRVVFDNLPEGLILFDGNGDLLAANSAFCRGIAGRPPREVVGRHYGELWRDIEKRAELHLEPQGPDAATVMPAADNAPIALRPASWRVLGTDFVGQQRWYAIDRIPVSGPNGKIEQCLERWSDITHQEELQRRLLIHEQMTSLGRLAASVAHEVGNPLQSAMGCLELCREDGSLSERADEYLGLALGELDRMGRTLESLRNLYRPPQISWAQVDLNQVIEQVSRFTQRQMRSAGVTLEMELAAGLPLIQGQPDALRQVLLNVFLNAVEAMPHGGELTVRTRSKATDRMCEVVIQDTGIGISGEQLKHLFEPFHTAKAQGVGLGLYLSRQIIEQHSGHIQIESDPGAGSSVSIHLPWATIPPGPRTSAAPKEEEV